MKSVKNYNSIMAVRKLLFFLKRYIIGSLRASGQLRKLKRQSTSSAYASLFPFDKKSIVRNDFFESAGVASGHYFHQDIFVAREILKMAPDDHFDVGSRIDGFVAHLAVFRKVKVFDIRELETTEPNIEFHQLDIMNSKQVSALPKIMSLSCLHTTEHFGLGRYGDEIEFDGWVVGIRNLTNLLSKGGLLYFSTPISVRQRIVFNSHRVFDPKFLTDFFLKDFDVVRMAMINDEGNLVQDVDFTSEEFLRSFNDSYACGIWILRRK